LAYADPTRTRFRLTDLELAAAALAAGDGQIANPGPSGAMDAMSMLTEAGLLDEGEVDPRLKFLIGVVATSSIDIVIEVSGFGYATHHAWISAGFGAVGIDIGGGQHEYLIVDPVLLPWTLATTLGVGPREAPGSRNSLQVPESLLNAAIEGLPLGESEEGVRKQLAEVLDPSSTEQLLGILRGWRASWRATSRFQRPTEPDLASQVVVVDAGSSGYWRVETDVSEDGSDITLVPIAPSEAWEYLHRLVPGLVEDGAFGFPDFPA